MQLFRSRPETDVIPEAEKDVVQLDFSTAAPSSPASPGMAHAPVALQQSSSPTPTPPGTSGQNNITALAGTMASTAISTPGASNPAEANKRFLVIHAETKRPKKGAAALRPEKHLNQRLRLMVLLLTTLFVFAGMLVVWIPLSLSQNNFAGPSGVLGSLIRSSTFNWSIQAHQNITPTPTTTTAGVTHTTANSTLPKSQYVAIAEQDATDVGISPTYFVRQINLESGFNPNAGSSGGAEGIAQFEPGTAAGLGINPWDPIQALKAAAEVMAGAYHKYGDYAKALGAYNAGSGTLQNAVNSCGANWLSCMPAQTQNYVAVIMGT